MPKGRYKEPARFQFRFKRKNRIVKYALSRLLKIQNI